MIFFFREEKKVAIFAKKATTGFASSAAPILVYSSMRLKQESATSRPVPFLADSGLEVIALIFRANLTNNETAGFDLLVRVLQEFAHILRNSGNGHDIKRRHFPTEQGDGA